MAKTLYTFSAFSYVIRFRTNIANSVKHFVTTYLFLLNLSTKLCWDYSDTPCKFD